MGKQILILFLALLSLPIFAQKIQQQFYKDSLSDQNITALNVVFGKNKTFDKTYQKQIFTALTFFPELKNVRIKFCLKETNTPLSSRPTFWSLFRDAKKRTYIITISTKTNAFLEPILLEKLSYNAQIGVLGHELSHVSDYSQKGFSQMIHLIWIEIFSKEQVDKFESGTDKICINHGLGYQLLYWSISVRENLKMENWRGADNIESKPKTERYLNPSKIREIIKTNPLYNK
ncbi:MAG: hypothetical protein ABI549_13475 [Flavobacterium sp.]|uniref:hypothetical protein n=1 Tax=Flavobacterium sp. TaxID=239 RepID=UPI003265B756